MSATIYGIAAVAIFCLGFYYLVVSADLLRRILAVNILGTGVFLLLIALTGRDEAATPDPVPRAMVLTGIVVAVSATALGLALARHIFVLTGQLFLSGDFRSRQGRKSEREGE